jgi:hypothetical protein
MIREEQVKRGFSVPQVSMNCTKSKLLLAFLYEFQFSLVFGVMFISVFSANVNKKLDIKGVL